MAFEHAVALTGGIASGKSSASAIFRDRGWVIIDADTIAHDILNQQHAAVGQLFGHTLVQDGMVDRKALGKIVFGDAARRRELEALLHPLIQEEITQKARHYDTLAEPYLIDIPLFYERKAYPISRVALVYAPRDVQITRMMHRDGLTHAEAIQRLDAQMDIETKRKYATWIIDNTGDLSHLKQECIRVSEMIRSV